MAEKEKKGKEAAEQEENLTEAQRIEKLERNVGTSKTVLMVVALLLIVVISVSVTAFAVFIAKTPDIDNSELATQIAGLREEVTSFSARLDDQAVETLKVSERIPEISQQLQNSSNAKMISLMIEQEDSNQQVLNTARNSIYDLAHMVPGSRTWLEVYSEELDAGIEQSKARQAKLKALMISNAAEAQKQEKSEKEKESTPVDDFGDF